MCNCNQCKEERFYESIQAMVDYLYTNEQKHWLECDKPKEHIYHSVKIVKKYLDGNQ